MIVSFRSFEPAVCPPREAQYVTPSQVFLSMGKHYEVHALSVYDGVCFLLVVDDASAADFKPRALFDVVDPELPADWICNTFPTGPVQLLIGPEFIARDVASYDDMIDQRAEQLARFRERLTKRAHGSGR